MSYCRLFSHRFRWNLNPVQWCLCFFLQTVTVVRILSGTRGGSADSVESHRWSAKRKAAAGTPPARTPTPSATTKVSLDFLHTKTNSTFKVAKNDWKSFNTGGDEEGFCHGFFFSECEGGYFGYRCRFQCACSNGSVCDTKTGRCPDGCPRDKWGVGCLLGKAPFTPTSRVYRNTILHKENCDKSIPFKFTTGFVLSFLLTAAQLHKFVLQIPAVRTMTGRVRVTWVSKRWQRTGTPARAGRCRRPTPPRTSRNRASRSPRTTAATLNPPTTVPGATTGSAPRRSGTTVRSGNVVRAFTLNESD